ncbi:MAG: alpha/beta hydrolase [Rhodospirillales bacterium CG15_BIG_FIL_POST_REV_8_21_14_020_66_15]|nr:MAG: alpha/beta hydrolase [Rhodospirillales bacterium CG15_BIG_FIL_POST_REV_8_21_14_020_66_15]
MPARQPLLLMPGLLCDDALWRHQLDTLADVAEIAVTDMTRDDDIDAMARRALDAAPDRFALCGLSMGGYAAQAVMRLAPERVTRLALLDTASGADTPERSAARRELMARAAADDLESVIDHHMPTLIAEDRQDDAELTTAVRASARNVGADAYRRQQTAIINRPDNRANLSRIACPTLVLCGRQDVLTPPTVHEEMASAIPGAKLVIVENCGHLSPLERPEAVSAVLRYWLAG